MNFKFKKKVATWLFSNSLGPEVGELLPHPEVGGPQQPKQEGEDVKQHVDGCSSQNLLMDAALKILLELSLSLKRMLAYSNLLSN